MGALQIRRVLPGDLDAVARIERECFPAAEAAGRESLAARIAVFPESFFVAEREGALIGMINGGATDGRTITDDLFGDAALHRPNGAWQAVYGLDVLPGHRGRGVAARLMERMIGAARQAGRRGVILTCKEGLLPYYERFGYRSLGVSASAHGGATWYDMILEF